MSNGPKFKKYHKSKGLQPWGETCSKTTHSNALRHHVKMVELLGWFVRTVQLNIGSRLEQSKYSCANSNLFVKEIGNAQNYTFLLFRQFRTGACLWEKLWCRARTHQALLLTGSFERFFHKNSALALSLTCGVEMMENLHLEMSLQIGTRS